MQSRAENRSCIEVNHQHILLELFSPCDECPLFVEDHASTVKNQFILSTDHIQINHNHAVIGCPGRQHLLPKNPLVGIIGRTINVDDHLGPGICLQRHRK